MTTIILTIIGILLAAAAALMVIFYGGDAFNSGSTKAKANEYINAGENLNAALDMYKADNAGASPESFGQLVGNDGSDGQPVRVSYLSQMPDFRDQSIVHPMIKPLPTEAPMFMILLQGSIASTQEMCRAINVASGRAPTAGGYTGRQGCNYSMRWFYRKV